jgi:hypothetical protein
VYPALWESALQRRSVGLSFQSVEGRSSVTATRSPRGVALLLAFVVSLAMPGCDRFTAHGTDVSGSSAGGGPDAVNLTLPRLCEVEPLVAIG